MNESIQLIISKTFYQYIDEAWLPSLFVFFHWFLLTRLLKPSQVSPINSLNYNSEVVCLCFCFNLICNSNCLTGQSGDVDTVTDLLLAHCMLGPTTACPRQNRCL